MVLCSDCALSLNPSLWRIVKKKRELEVVIKQMKAEIDRLSKQIDVLELAVAVKNYFDIILKTRGSSEESRRLIEVLEKLEDIAERLRVLESSVKVKAKVARRPYQALFASPSPLGSYPHNQLRNLFLDLVRKFEIERRKFVQSGLE
jgi:hypothetical protein